MDSRGSLERSLRQYMVSRYLVGAAVLGSAEALWSCWQSLTGLVGGACSEQIEPWAEECGKMQSRSGVPGGSREGGYDSIRGRVALVPFLHGRSLADNGLSVVGLSFGLLGFCERFADNGYLLCLRLKHKLPRCFPACEFADFERTSQLADAPGSRGLDRWHVEMTRCHALEVVSRASACSSLTGPCMA